MVLALSRHTLKEIVDHFGLKHVRRLNIDIPLDGIVTITAEMYIEKDGLDGFIPILKEYHLTEIKDRK